MSNLKNNLMTVLVLGILISSIVLIAPLTANSHTNAFLSIAQTTACPDKVVTSVSPASGDASITQIVDITVDNAAYFTISDGEVFYLAIDAFAVDSADPSNVIAGTTSQYILPAGCCVNGFNPLILRVNFNFGSANACKTFNFYVTTKCVGVVGFGQSDPGGSFTTDCPLAALTAKVKIDKSRRPFDDKFDVQGTFILNPASDGIDPLSEDFTLQLGSFSTTIPAGSFIPTNNNRLKFTGVIGGVSLDVDIRALRGGGFDMKANGDYADLTALANPLSVKLTIGNDSGSTTVTAKIK